MQLLKSEVAMLLKAMEIYMLNILRFLLETLCYRIIHNMLLFRSQYIILRPK